MPNIKSQTLRNIGVSQKKFNLNLKQILIYLPKKNHGIQENSELKTMIPQQSLFFQVDII